MTLSIVIPAHNEEENLPATLSELQQALDQDQIPYEIIVVNDNSTDGTGAVLAELCRHDSRIRAVTRRPPGGFGRALRSGIESATGDALIVYMADLSDHPGDAVAYYRKLEEGYDCVFGSRFIRGSHVEKYPFGKWIVNRIVNKCIQWMFWCQFNDLTNAFKAYRMEVVRACGPYRASHFNITLEMSLSALIRRYEIAQVPIRWYGRTWGTSKLKLREMGRKYLCTLLMLYFQRRLISDDLLAERLAVGLAHEKSISDLDSRLKHLEEVVSGLRPPR